MLPLAWLGADLVRILVAGAAWGFGFACFFLLPKYLATEVDTGPAGIGFVMGIFGVASFLLTPFGGYAVDAWPHRKTFTIGSILLGSSAIGFFAVDQIGLGMAFLRIIQAGSHVLVFTAVTVAVADLAPKERMSEALGLAGASILVMNAVAPAVIEPVVSRFGWNSLFGTALASAVICLILSRNITTRPRPLRVDGDTGGLRSVLYRPLTIHYAIVVFAAGIIFGSLFAFQQPYALDLGLTEVRGFFVAFATSALIVRIFFGGVPDRFGRHRVASGALGLYAITALIFSALPAAWFETCGAIFGLAHGFFIPALNANVLTRTPPSERGRLMAIFAGSFNLGIATTTLLGFVAEVTGYPFVFACTGISTAAATILLACSRELREPHEPIDTEIT